MGPLWCFYTSGGLQRLNTAEFFKLVVSNCVSTADRIACSLNITKLTMETTKVGKNLTTLRTRSSPVKMPRSGWTDEETEYLF